MAFDPFADPFSSFNPGFGGSSQPPKLPDRVAEDLLDQIGDGLVGGLGYIGGILDKPGRAIRGLADTLTGGGPQSHREALAILPFSDSIGLTKSDQRVSGKKILGNLGLIDDTPSQGFDENDAAGIGAELLLDPLSYLGIGTLTKGGKLLQKAGGNVKTGFAGRAAGADLLQSNVDDFLSKFGGGVATARDLTTKADSIIPKGVQGVNPRFNIVPETTERTIPFLPNAKLPQDVQDIIKGGKQFGPSSYRKASFTPEGEALIHSLDIGDDAFKISTAKAVREATDDATRLGSTITLGKAPLGIDRLLGLEPFRIESPFLDRGIDALSAGIQGSKLGSGFSRLFDSRVGNARTPEVQSVQREVGAPAREAYRAEALGQSMEIRHEALDGFAPLVNSGNEAEAMRYLRQAVELKDPFQSPSGIRYAAPKQFAEYERQLATRPAENPIFANRLDEMKSTGHLDAMRNSFLGLQKLGDDMAGFMKTVREGEQITGVNSNELLENFINYLPRQKNQLPRKAGESGFAYAGRVLSDALGTTHEGQIARKEMLRNIPGGTTQIEDWAANQGLRQLTPLQREAYFVEDLTGNPISAATVPEVRQQAKQLSDWVVNLGDYGKDGAALFNKDLFASTERRALGGAAAKGGMDATLEAVRRFSIPEAEALAQGVPFTRVSEFLGQDGFGAAAKDLARRDLRLNSANELSGMVLPQDIAVDLAKTQKAWTQPEEVQGLLRLWDAGLQMFKGAVTYPFPAFHVRNIGSGIYNMWRDNAASGSAMRDAYKVLTSNADLPYITREQLVNEAVANRVAFTPHTKQFGDVLGPGESFIQGLPGKLNGEGLGENLLAGAKANAPESWKDVGFIVREGKAAGSMVEDWIRLSHYLAKKQQGFEPAAAAAAVRKYQYDYCVDGETTALTKAGWKKYSEITESDQVLTIEPETRWIEWCQVQKVNVFDFDGNLNLWENGIFRAVSTDNHKWLCRGSGIRGGHHSLAKPHYHFSSTDELSDPKCRKIVDIGGGEPMYDPMAYYDDEFVELVGWYLTEGWRNPKSPTGIFVSQSNKHNLVYVERIRRIAEFYRSKGASVSEVSRDLGWGEVITFRFGMGIGSSVNDACPDKALTVDFLNLLTSKQLCLLQETMVDGDGHRPGDSEYEIFTQKDLGRSVSFQILCSMIGKRTNLVYSEKQGVYHVKVYASQTVYVESLTKTKIPYIGKIWCPTTKNGTWMACREGRTFWTGNSQFTQFERNTLKRLIPWWCVPVSHEILTKEGWKFSHELKVGEEVMSYHQKFGTLLWTPLQDVQEFDFDGELMEIDHKRGHFLFTDDHRWPVETVANRVNSHFYPSRKVVKKGYELVDGDSIPRCGNFMSSTSILSPRLAALLGWVVTDGTFRWRQNHCEMVIYQSDKKFWKEIMVLTGLPARDGIDIRMDEPVRVYPVAIEDVKEITKIFRSKEDLPGIVCQLGPAAAQAMYRAMLQAEGSYAGPNRATVYFSQKAERNKPVLEAFQILCLLSGRSAAVKEAGCYVTTNGFMKFQKSTTKRRQYTGKIWCPVTSFGTWVMRHEGHTIITGNSFSRNNLPPLLEEIATNPAKLAGSVRVATSRPDGQFVPRYISEGPSIPLPGGAPGTDRYIASLGLPFEDELVRTIGNLAKGDTTRATQQTIGTLFSPIKYPIEQAFGVQAHTGRKLEDLKPTPFAELLSSVLPVTPQAANQLVGLTPLARFGSVSSQVADERKSVLDKIINLGTGAWITDVDATKARNVEVRDMLENLLRQNKGVSSFDKFYVKPENLPKLNPDELQAYLLYRNLEDKAKEQAAKRKAALPLPGGF